MAFLDAATLTFLLKPPEAHDDAVSRYALTRDEHCVRPASASLA